ncbi:MAG: valine--tRNA ligase [Phycisphaerae bacterium]
MTEGNTLETTYDPTKVEQTIYDQWERAGAFESQPADTPHEKTFTIVIPPPNVTGALHLGHALNNTLQDILVRYHRMRGFNTLWQPGTDHAGIATQAVVERRIRELEGKTRHDLGREELVRRIWEWKSDYEKRIISQLKSMGCSCDWQRLRFTLDEGMSRAVRRMFLKLFADGLIFRGKRLVNWDTQLQTAVSDDEVYHETVKGFFWHFKYPVIDPKPDEPDHVIIATTRPETMLGDTAVAVHPDPEGYLDKMERALRDGLGGASAKDEPALQAKLKTLEARRETHLPQLKTLCAMARDGRTLLLPLVERKIPLVCDEWAKPELGSGCVKITPAHDPNDYEVGVRHDLPMINVLTADGKIAPIIEPDGSLNPNSNRYEGLTFTGDGREQVVADLESRELLHEVEERDREVGHSDRSKVAIEPYLSDQWFVRTGDCSSGSVRLGDGATAPGLAQAAMDAVTDQRIRVFPPRYGKSYLDWLGEKRDWCISRQLWWGHRIPVWDVAEATERDKAEPLWDKIESYHTKNQVAWQAKPESADSAFEAADSHLDAYFCVHPNAEALQAEMESHGFARDEHVLDTWFSSALWPFSTLGWPDETEHLKQYYPGSVLCTGRDIITNWVARMVMFGLYATGKIPFDHVYIHPKILDGRGETMSKSKGNGVDPLDIIHTHGADALRYSMADMCTETQDIRMPVDYICPHCNKLTDQTAAVRAEQQNRKSRGERLERKIQPADCHRVKCVHKECGKEFATRWAEPSVKDELSVARETSEKFEIGRNFCNKLWNAARFSFMNLEGTPCDDIPIEQLPPEDRWILARLSRTIRQYHESVAAYQFSSSVKGLRVFFWESLCDWYIELTKPRMAMDASDPLGGSARQVLAFCLDQVLRLFHPTIPFITERLWQQLETLVPTRGLPGIAELETGRALIVSAFPPVAGYPQLEDSAILEIFANLQTATRGVRDLRTQCGVPPKEKVTATVILPQEKTNPFEANAHIIKHMAGVAELHIAATGQRPANAGSVAIKGMRIFVHDISDDAAEHKRITKSLGDLQKQIKGKEAKLGNEKFVANAKPEVVEAERTRLAAMLEQQTSLTLHLRELEN